MMGQSALLQRLAGIVLALGMVVVAPPVWAQDEIDVNIYARERFYLGGSASFLSPSFLSDVENTVRDFIHPAEGGFQGADATQSLNWAYGFNARVGYRFHPHFAFELEYEWIDANGFPVFVAVEKSGERREFKPSTIEVRRPEWVVTANQKIFFTKGRTQPFVSLGMGVMHGSIEPGENPVSTDLAPPGEVKVIGLGQQRTGSLTRTAFTFRFGGGMDFYLSEHIVFETLVDYVYPMGTLENVMDYVSISFGLQYHF